MNRKTKRSIVTQNTLAFFLGSATLINSDPNPLGSFDANHFASFARQLDTAAPVLESSAYGPALGDKFEISLPLSEDQRSFLVALRANISSVFCKVATFARSTRVPFDQRDAAYESIWSSVNSTSIESDASRLGLDVKSILEDLGQFKVKFRQWMRLDDSSPDEHEVHALSFELLRKLDDRILSSAEKGCIAKIQAGLCAPYMDWKDKDAVLQTYAKLFITSRVFDKENEIVKFPTLEGVVVNAEILGPIHLGEVQLVYNQERGRRFSKFIDRYRQSNGQTFQPLTPAAFFDAAKIILTTLAMHPYFEGNHRTAWTLGADFLIQKTRHFVPYNNELAREFEPIATDIKGTLCDGGFSLLSRIRLHFATKKVARMLEKYAVALDIFQ